MIFGKLLQGIFKSRPNRFLGIVDVEGSEKLCFIPNPGRMEELLIPGVSVYLKPVSSLSRSTTYDLILVEHNELLVSIDSRLPNKLIADAVIANQIPDFYGFSLKKTEPSYLDSRFDLLLENGKDLLLLEVKSCTLVVGERALFPDAPTKRGTKHLRTLFEAKKMGFRSVILFLIQRSDAASFSPNTGTDSDFSNALQEAMLKGVEIVAYDCLVTLEAITLKERVPVDIQ